MHGKHAANFVSEGAFGNRTCSVAIRGGKHSQKKAGGQEWRPTNYTHLALHILRVNMVLSGLSVVALQQGSFLAQHKA